MNIIDFIPTGKENRIALKSLQGATGITDPAELRRAIHKARCSGEPICNDGNGYYLAECSEDLNHSIRRMNSRISKQIAAREGMKKAARKLEAM